VSAPMWRDAPGTAEETAPTPRQAGFAAFRQGKPIEACPSHFTPAPKRQWRDGWREAFHLSHTPNGTPAESPEGGAR
jgi:ribosome modulation factor